MKKSNNINVSQNENLVDTAESVDSTTAAPSAAASISQGPRVALHTKAHFKVLVQTAKKNRLKKRRRAIIAKRSRQLNRKLGSSR